MMHKSPGFANVSLTVTHSIKKKRVTIHDTDQSTLAIFNGNLAEDTKPSVNGRGGIGS